MSFYDSVDSLIRDTLYALSGPFGAELALCATIVLLLAAAMFRLTSRIHPFYIAATGTITALYLAAPWVHLDGGSLGQPGGPPCELFTGMLVHDSLSIYMRGLLLFFAILFATFVQMTGVPRREKVAEFHVLVLGATLGMCLMVSANHLMIVFLGFEMASVPSYVLAAFQKGRRQSSEAALKYAVFGGAAAGVMLYGISLLVGVLGSAHLPTMSVRLAEVLHSGEQAPALLLGLGGLMLAVGVAFKLSAVPFHFWTPDVFEGASAEVAAFLSIASKAAAIGLLLRLSLGLCVIGGGMGRMPVTHGQDAHATSVIQEQDAPAASNEALAPARQFLVALLTLLAIVTCTFGNLAAYGQTNFKRLLAYSTIAHAGYLLMPVTAAVALAANGPAATSTAVAAVAFYLAIYLFMNLAAFAFCAAYRNASGSEEIADYAGLWTRSPGIVVCMIVVLFSLVGLPPFAGFLAKFTIFAALAEAKLWLLLGVGVLNTVLSLFYYLRVARVMAIERPSTDGPTAAIPLASFPGAYCLLVSLPLIALGLWGDGLIQWATSAASEMF